MSRWDDDWDEWEADMRMPFTCSPAFFVPDLNDYHAADRSYIWARMVLINGETQLDLDISEDQLGEMSNGIRAEYFSDHETDVFYSLVDHPFATHHYEDDKGWMWMLENGIAPEQPFLIEFAHGHASVSYEGEHDYEPNINLVRVLPWPEARSLEAWHRVLRRMLTHRDIADREERARRQARWASPRDICVRYIQETKENVFGPPRSLDKYTCWVENVIDHAQLCSISFYCPSSDVLYHLRDQLYPLVYEALGMSSELFDNLDVYYGDNNWKKNQGKLKDAKTTSVP